MSYNYTTNLGNEIQSIASRRFLPSVDYYVEHEKLEQFDSPDKVKMIMNGWFLDSPTAWPPSDKIDPLLISMHFSTTSGNDRTEVILSDDSKDFFSRYGPVGCRDYATLNFLNENDIDAFFSGCLTLTLDSGNQKPPHDEGNKYIVVNMEKPDRVISFLKQKSDKKIYRIEQDMFPSFEKAFPGSMKMKIFNLTSYYSDLEKLFIAENLLKIYENADCVITDRLHCALPCLAFNTPVMLFRERGKKERFDGLSEFIFESTFEEYENNYNIFDVDNPPENSNEHLKIRNDLIKRCKKFTGHINDSCYSTMSYNELLDDSSMLVFRNALSTRQYFADVLRMERDIRKKNKKTISNKNKVISDKNQTIKNQKNKIKKLEEKNRKQKEFIDSILSSNSWKVTAPMRKLKRKL